MVIMNPFICYTHLVPLKDAAISEPTFKKLQWTIFDIHGLPLSIILNQDSLFTSKFWSQMIKSFSVQVWMATRYYHRTNGQVERRILTLKQMMRNFVNKKQNNWSGALPAITAARNGALMSLCASRHIKLSNDDPREYSILSREPPARYQQLMRS